MKTVSIIIPTLNEEQYIERAIESLLQDQYPTENLEILVVDGNSQDKTVEIVRRLQQKYPFIRLLHNPKRITPAALNIGLKHATGEIIIRADAHATYPANYISQLVDWLQRLKADNVGGRFVHTPAVNTPEAHAIAAVFESPFGVGNAQFRTTNRTEPFEVDTVPFGCWHRSVFDRIGLFDERLARNQDIEFNKRLKRAGGKIFLIPQIKIQYHPRQTFAQLAKYAFKNGYWNILTVLYTGSLCSLSIRHFVPMFFVLGLMLPLLLSPLDVRFALLTVAGLTLYFAAALYFALRSKTRSTSILHIMLAFFILHFFYGLGEIYAVFRGLKRKNGAVQKR